MMLARRRASCQSRPFSRNAAPCSMRDAGSGLRRQRGASGNVSCLPSYARPFSAGFLTMGANFFSANCDEIMRLVHNHETQEERQQTTAIVAMN